ncbi:MAG: hypothetical protein QM770_07530 [Tepidisphaeraceae bacterium]
MQALFVIPLIVVMVLMFGPDHALPLVGFLVAMIAVMFVHRALSVRPGSMARQQHSRYDGYPLIATLLPLPERLIKWFVEPVLVAVVGALLLPVSTVLGKFIIVAGIVNAGLTMMRDFSFEWRARQMSDRVIEQRQLAARLRELQRNTFND